MNPLIEDNLNKSRLNLEDAKFLLEDQRYTAAIKRAYYAAWHAVQALLASENISTKKNLRTQVVFNHLFIKTGVSSKDVSDKISLLEQLKENSDNNPDYRATITEASNAVSVAIFIITAVEDYFK